MALDGQVERGLVEHDPGEFGQGLPSSGPKIRSPVSNNTSPMLTTKPRGVSVVGRTRLNCSSKRARSCCLSRSAARLACSWAAISHPLCAWLQRRPRRPWLQLQPGLSRQLPPAPSRCVPFRGAAPSATLRPLRIAQFAGLVEMTAFFSALLAREFSVSFRLPSALEKISGAYLSAPRDFAISTALRASYTSKGTLGSRVSAKG